MLCDICKKNEATVHLTEVVNENITELHICEQCARAKGASMYQHFGIAELLSGLVDMPDDMVSKKSHINIKCPACNMSYDNFKKIGRFGCARCYETFSRALFPLFKKIHGTPCHIGRQAREIRKDKIRSDGKSQKPRSAKDILKDIRLELADAVEKEEFEKAAVLRDKIKMLESGEGKR
ncbi:MAG: UvrB/UvrC motif-containing protein [Candidatus Omnitrophica bacterium]|nr:UvrB/UvrC motif-containing protein [Candidatus Omnitrophota bacterium]